jgi:hypothetical protein
MTLSTFDGLVSSIGGWLMRDDLTAVIPDFIALAEADMSQRLRLRAMLTRATTTISGDGYETLPSDFLGMWRLTLDGGEIRFAPAARMAGYAEEWRGSAPMFFSVVGEQLQFAPTGPTPGGVLEMTYYARPEALSDDNQTNAILLASPAVYLYGALMQSAPYLADDQRVATWGALYQQACDLLQAADDAAEFAGPLVIRLGSAEMAP